MTYSKYNSETNSTDDDDEEYERQQAIQDAKTEEELKAEYQENQAKAKKWCEENPDKLEF